MLCVFGLVFFPSVLPFLVYPSAQVRSASAELLTLYIFYISRLLVACLLCFYGLERRSLSNLFYISKLFILASRWLF
jgi:hypothetical protein